MALPSDLTDVLVVGGSHAGLSAALTLYRALHTSIIFDEHKPRNWYSAPVHLTPTWEHQDPEKLREACRMELRQSGLCRFIDATVQRAERLSNGLFRLTDANGELWHGKKVLLTTGVRDIFPDLDGYKENYPRRMLVPSLQSLIFSLVIFWYLSVSFYCSCHDYILHPCISL